MSEHEQSSYTEEISRYFGFDEIQCCRYMELMTGNRTSWPPSLKMFVAVELEPIGYSYDVLTEAIAKWIKLPNHPNPLQPGDDLL